MSARWTALLIWAAVAASVLFWGLRLFTSPLSVPPGTLTVSGQGAAGGDLTRLFGLGAAPVAQASEPAAPPRFRLLGVVAPRDARQQQVALALIAVDDEPAKAYRVGARIEGETVLQQVRARGVSLGPRDGPGMTLELAPLEAPATGELPDARNLGARPAQPAGPVRFMPPPPPTMAPAAQGMDAAAAPEAGDGAATDADGGPGDDPVELEAERLRRQEAGEPTPLPRPMQPGTIRR